MICYNIKQQKCKCVEGDSYHQRPTGIQRHRLRALFGRDVIGNTTGADQLNRTVSIQGNGLMLSRLVRITHVTWMSGKMIATCSQSSMRVGPRK